MPRDRLSPNLTLLDRWAIEPTRVDKPWGYELIWALTDHYCGKLLVVHGEKDESWYVLEGRAEIEMAGAGEKSPAREVVTPGAAFRITAGTVHRVRALEDTTILEVSTPQIDDVVRLEDAYGREGTSSP